MEKIKLTLSLLKKIETELKEKIINNHLAHISIINSTDILIQFSFYVKEKLFISLNHHSPLISLVDKNYSSPTIMGGLSENLRKNLKGTYITDVSILNNDRVMKFSLTRTNDFYEKENLFLILELIPTKTNLIILDKDGKIIYAYHYTDITHSRPILKGMIYESLHGNKDFKEIESTSLDNYKKYVQEYLIEAEGKRKKENQLPLYNQLVSKKKSLTKKIDVLNKEKEKASSELIYKEYGEYLYTYMYSKEELQEYISNNLKEIYDENLSVSENANRLFNKYKKSLKTIECDDIEINKAEEEIKDITNILNTFNYLSDEELAELHNRYMVNRHVKPKKVKSNPRLPFYIVVDGVTIGFGKNSLQNDYISFKKAKKQDIFLHINEQSGSHVIVFDNKPSNNVLLTASEICLILSNKVAGDIKYCPVSEIKKGPSQGLVIVDSYKLITLRNIRLETYELLKTQKRFD